MRTLKLQPNRLTGPDVQAWQTFLISRKLLAAGGADGIYGPKTDHASRTFQQQRQLVIDGLVGLATQTVAVSLGYAPPVGAIIPGLYQLDSASRKHLGNLNPQLAIRMLMLFNRVVAKHPKLKPVLTSSYRSFAEQDALYAQGRTRAGSIVTNAKGGRSNHNYRLACDAACLRGTRIVWDAQHEQLLSLLGQEARAVGLGWGGTWQGFRDLPHFQLTTGLTTGRFLELYHSAGNQLSAVWAEINGRLVSAVTPGTHSGPHPAPPWSEDDGDQVE